MVKGGADLDSILNTVKKMLGLSADYDAFDTDVIMCINSALMVANQLGLGPEDGFAITGPDETWEDFLGENKRMLEAFQQYVYMRVKLTFDPPANSFVVSSLEKQVDELTWRLNVQAEAVNQNE